MYPDTEKSRYNIKHMTIQQWYDSEPMRQARLLMFEDSRTSVCTRCYLEEDAGATSRRYRCNQKSVIFTQQNFEESYEQSPGHDHFEHSWANAGATTLMPIDLHIDLGNHCNLACKMCYPRASSSIAAQYVKWGIQDAEQYIGTDWTRDEQVWQRVLAELVAIKNLKHIHFMGGETLITRRFEDFVDYMIAHDRLDLSFGFVTNGTTFNEALLNKLKKFSRIGIEVSIESLTEHNAYQRQGTNTAQVLANIDRYLEHCNNSNITLTIRPAISALTIGSYATLLKFCLDRQLIIKSLMVYYPTYLDVRVLPESVRAGYRYEYEKLLHDYDLAKVDTQVDYNESDPHELQRSIKNQITQCINLLDAPCLPKQEQLFAELVAWCRRWDNVYGYNALELYPELQEEFVRHGY